MIKGRYIYNSDVQWEVRTRFMKIICEDAIKPSNIQ